MLEFDHIGLVTNEKMGNENWIEKTGVWATNPGENKFSIEWLRFADDSSLTGPVRTQPHVAFKVDSIEEESKGLKELIKPFKPADFVTVAFFEYHGLVIELMKYSGDKNQWFDGKRYEK